MTSKILTAVIKLVMAIAFVMLLSWSENIVLFMVKEIACALILVAGNILLDTLEDKPLDKYENEREN